jgi:hypothetical protein
MTAPEPAARTGHPVKVLCIACVIPYIKSGKAKPMTPTDNQVVEVMEEIFREDDQS